MHYVNRCFDTGEWTLRTTPCRLGIDCDGEGCFSIPVESVPDGNKIVVLLECIDHTYSSLLDGDNPMPRLAEAYRKITGKGIAP